MSLSVVKEVLSNLFKKSITRKYPFEKRKPYERFRGKITIDYSKCVGCGLCARYCPALAITMQFFEVHGKKLRRPIVRIYECISCGQCALVCPRKAISFTHDFELATFNKYELVLKPPEFKKLEEGEKR